MPMFAAAIPAIFSAVGSAASATAGALGLGGAAAGAPMVLGSAALNGVAGATAAGGSSAGLGSLASSILGGTATAFSALSQMRAGRQQSDAMRQQAIDAQLEATQEDINGQRREVSLKNQLASTLGSISTAYAASGIDLSYGSAATMGDQAATRADQELTLDRATTEMRKTRLNQRAGSYLGLAREARASSILQAAGSAAGGLMKIAYRG